MKLHIGCGGDIKPGWLNIDSGADGPEFCARADFVHDVRKGLLPISNSVQFIYAQHFFEHLTRDEGIAFLRECKRVLVPNGVVRLSMPDLREFVRLYLDGGAQALLTWKDAGWLPKSAAQMLNEEFRSWGHKFIYDRAEVFASLRAAGFAENNLSSHAWGYSGHEELCGLETRPKHWNDLIVEASA
jgi:predicted SAM-dependent methyltransferase